MLFERCYVENRKWSLKQPVEEFLFRNNILLGHPDELRLVCTLLNRKTMREVEPTPWRVRINLSQFFCSIGYVSLMVSIIPFSCCIQAEGPLMQIGEDFAGEPLTVTYHRHMYGLGEHYNSTKPMDWISRGCPVRSIIPIAGRLIWII